MALRQRPSTPRSRSEQRALEREFWDSDTANGGEPRKAAFAETVTSYRRWLRARRRP
ncbi:MAG: hypothetical protein ACXVKA_09825 [Acidimicrobiia bacterium]